VKIGVSTREMQEADIDAGLRLCRAWGWNQTRRDWEFLFARSAGGSRVAVKQGRVIGTVTTIRYEDRFSWIGMLLVEPAEAGQGTGTHLLAAAMDALDDMPSVRLDATPAGRQVYGRQGFADEYGLSRMLLAPRTGAVSAPRDHRARRMTPEDLAAVAAVDREVFGADRRIAIDWMFDGAPEHAWVVEEHGQTEGYILGRHGFNFEHLGPIVARSQETARALVLAALDQRADKPFIIDASHHDPGWPAWLEGAGFREQRPFIRMFSRGNPYPGAPPQQFGILGPEFG
jgi:GNAT superfamily N-acetyltransferase